jgi:ubiquinone/menaquinone biosynthesis C-methylase UbiE
MDVKTFYENTASKHINNNSNSIPKPQEFVGQWGQKSRIQLAYEMLATESKFSHFLDIGCGDLTNLITLEKLFERGFGVDIAAYPSWKPLQERFTTYQHNLDDGSLPFSDRMFDAVTILMVLEHVFDPFAVIEEISRVTKTGGYLVINVPNIGYIKHRLGLLFGKLPITSTRHCWEMREWDGGHIHYFTIERLAWLLDKFGGYKVLKTYSSGRLGQIKRMYPSLLCSDIQLLCRKEK